MNRSSTIGLAFVTLAAAAYGQSSEKAYESFQAKSASTPTFTFSKALATSKSPVVISVEGRKLTDADRKYRTDLQKHWLSVNVPKEYELRIRTLNQCDRIVKGEHAFCDVYTFADPQSGNEVSYYIYVGNWP